MEFMATESKTIEASRSRIKRASRGLFAHRVGGYFVVVTIVLLVASIAGIAIGSTSVAAATVARVLAFHIFPQGIVDINDIPEPQQVIVWLIRTPRVIGGALGAVLALATGLAMHSIFYLPVMSFVGALLALFLVYAIATRRGRTPVSTLLLTGVALNALIGAVTSFVISLHWVRREVAQEILFWMMGGLDSRSWKHVWLALPCVVIGLFVALVYSRDLDVLLLGEETALAVGADIEKVKRVILTSSALLTGAAVAVSGLIGFVGLVVPHIVRLIIGPRHRYLLPASALTGAAFLILTDILARTVRRPEEIRLGIVTAILGAPFFLYLLLRHYRAASIG